MTTTTTGPDRTELRQQVRDLIGQGLSNRAIARQLGTVSRDTVSRWRTQFATEQPAGAPADAPPAEVARPPGAPTAATAATGDAPADAPPAGQATLTIEADDRLREHLAVLAEGGLTTQDAIACSLRLIAEAVRSAWDYGICPRGLLPTIQTRTSHPAATLDAPNPAASTTSTDTNRGPR